MRSEGVSTVSYLTSAALGLSNADTGLNNDLRSISIELLKAELLRRDEDNGTNKPTCGTTGKRGTYNVPIHVLAVLIIFVLSTIGVKDLPILAIPSSQIYSMCLPSHRKAVSLPANPSPIHLLLETLRYRCSHCDCVHTPPPNGLHFYDGSMPAEILERDIPSYAWLRCHACCICCGQH